MSKTMMSGPKAGTWGLYFASTSYLARYKSQAAALKAQAAAYAGCGTLVPIPAVA